MNRTRRLLGTGLLGLALIAPAAIASENDFDDAHRNRVERIERLLTLAEQMNDAKRVSELEALRERLEALHEAKLRRHRHAGTATARTAPFATDHDAPFATDDAPRHRQPKRTYTIAGANDHDAPASSAPRSRNGFVVPSSARSSAPREVHPRFAPHAAGNARFAPQSAGHARFAPPSGPATAGHDHANRDPRFDDRRPIPAVRPAPGSALTPVEGEARRPIPERRPAPGASLRPTYRGAPEDANASSPLPAELRGRHDSRFDTTFFDRSFAPRSDRFAAPDRPFDRRYDVPQSRRAPRDAASSARSSHVRSRPSSSRASAEAEYRRLLAELERELASGDRD